MIRKDILPNIWGDSWHSEATEQTLTVARGTERTVVLCNPADAPMFMLREGLGYNVMPDIENLRINVEQGGRFTLYRLQGMNTTAQHITQLNLTMQDNATVDLCTVTLGGGHVRNNITVRMQGEGCRLNADGLYLIDREQECDNYIFVEHAKPRCHSRELYKGIMDDAARARFNGHVLVQDGAVKTEAYQPFLEIYNDDVKCSHGSTVGQLDSQAMFYLMTRGISERTAVTMLSYAFCDEVIRNIGISSLRDAVGDMVKKRLHGELTPCDECALHCTSPCNGPEANFHIDPTKL